MDRAFSVELFPIALDGHQYLLYLSLNKGRVISLAIVYDHC
jgi:hypothetical protein